MKAGEDAASDTSYMLNETVTLEGIVNMPTGLSYAGSGVKFIFADVNGGPGVQYFLMIQIVLHSQPYKRGRFDTSNRLCL